MSTKCDIVPFCRKHATQPMAETVMTARPPALFSRSMMRIYATRHHAVFTREFSILSVTLILLKVSASAHHVELSCCRRRDT